MSTDVVIVGAVRTPVGKFRGSPARLTSSPITRAPR